MSTLKPALRIASANHDRGVEAGGRDRVPAAYPRTFRRLRGRMVRIAPHGSTPSDAHRTPGLGSPGRSAKPDDDSFLPRSPPQRRDKLHRDDPRPAGDRTRRPLRLKRTVPFSLNRRLYVLVDAEEVRR